MAMAMKMAMVMVGAAIFFDAGSQERAPARALPPKRRAGLGRPNNIEW